MKGNRIQEVTMEITVGAFIFMILLGLGIFTIVVSQRSIFKTYYDYQVEFHDVAGLREGENVYSRGLMIGKVGGIEFVEDSDGVRVDLRLDKPLRLKEDYQVEISESSLLGGRRVAIIEGSVDSPLLPESEFNQLRGELPGDVMKEALATVRTIRESVVSSGIIENIQRFTEDLVQMSAAVNTGSGTVHSLLYDGALYSEASELAASLNTISTRLSSGQGTIGRLLDPDRDILDEMMGDITLTMSNLNMAVANVRNLTDKAAAGEGLIGRMFNDNEPLYTNLVAASVSIRNIAESFESSDGTLGRLINDPTLYDNLMETSASLKSIAERVNTGEGSLAKLLNDEDLYKDAQGLVNEARATIDDLRETSPITTFSSIFFGAF